MRSISCFQQRHACLYLLFTTCISALLISSDICPSGGLYAKTRGLAPACFNIPKISVASPGSSNSRHVQSTGIPLPSRTKRNYATARGRSRLLATSVTNAATNAATRGIGSYFLVRIAFLRGLGFVYIVAFLVALHQNKALMGDDGITPARLVLESADDRGRRKKASRNEWDDARLNKYKYPNSVVKNTKVYKALRRYFLESSVMNKYLREPYHNFWDKSDPIGRPIVSLLWLAKDRRKLNRWLDLIALSGLFLACILFTSGAANVPLLLGLWTCQHSLMSVGSPWYGYGWEPMLAEVTFHAMFMVPLTSLNPISILTPVPMVTVYAMRWLIFRIMFGAGLIKIKSYDKKWKDLTAMDYFYETMPAPNMLTRYFHRMPKVWHKFETIANHVVELVAPWFLILPLIPRGWRINAALLQWLFQVILIFSGNLSFLNWLTMLPTLFCLDDAALSKFFVPLRTTSASVAAYTAAASYWGRNNLSRKFVNFAFGALIIKLSIPVVRNLLARRQLMNSSFDPLRLVNTYGAFGDVNEERIELIVEATDDLDSPWREYHFKIKPGELTRRPRWISPYHYRLDWQMWIASCAGGIERSPWMYSFLLKVLRQDEDVLALLDGDPWAATADDEQADPSGSGNAGKAKKKKPRYIRVERYKYNFSPRKQEVKGTSDDSDGEIINGTSEDSSDGESRQKQYWVRERVGRYFPRQGVASEALLQELVQRSRY